MTKKATTQQQWHPVSLPPDCTSNATEVLLRVVDTLARLARRGMQSPEAVERVRTKWLDVRIPRSNRAQSARVWISVMCDIVSQGWSVRRLDRSVQIRPPIANSGDVGAEKARVRAGHLVERDRLLREESTRRFVLEMERLRLFNGAWHSVFSLMRDGEELREALEYARQSQSMERDALRSAIDPYLQVAESGTACQHTGLDLYDIWRYFRLTWSTVPQSVPGRRLHILVRDRSTPSHSIIGILAISSAVVQLGVRDQWIGWDSSTFLSELSENPSVHDAAWLKTCLDEAFEDLYVTDLVRDGILKRRELRSPSPGTADRLRRESKKARDAHERYARAGRHKVATVPADRANWRTQAESYLFRSKRAISLATLLDVREQFNAAGMQRPSAAALSELLGTARGRKAIAYVLRTVKARHVGIDMADITVCGAVAPYGEVLGGKLVSLLAASPEVAAIYERKYRSAVSLIASSMKGDLVQRRPRLVLLGTTSLYGVGASQYNRIVVPRERLGPNANGDLRFEELGRTVGFGSYHFGQRTAEEVSVLAQHLRDGRRVNSIFGEGVNPKLRRIREALSACGYPPEVLLQHGSPRIVYGVALALNFREVLLGRSTRVRRVMGAIRPDVGTETIARFWRERWLTMRIERSEVLDRLASHSVRHPIRHGARVALPQHSQDLPLFETS